MLDGCSLVFGKSLTGGKYLVSRTGYSANEIHECMQCAQNRAWNKANTQ